MLCLVKVLTCHPCAKIDFKIFKKSFVRILSRNDGIKGTTKFSCLHLACNNINDVAISRDANRDAKRAVKQGQCRNPWKSQT